MTNLIRNQRGLALVLAVSLVGLLSSLGVYLIWESGTAFRMTKAMARYESAFNLAEAALQLGLRCVRRSAPSPGFQQINSATVQTIQDGIPDYISSQSLGQGTITPRIDYLGYSTTPPPGWMLNWQGYSSFHGVYYRPVGQGIIPLPSTRGNAQSTVAAITLKVAR